MFDDIHEIDLMNLTLGLFISADSGEPEDCCRFFQSVDYLELNYAVGSVR